MIRGSAGIYGSEPTAPQFFDEEMARLYPLRTRFQRDVGEIENYFETYARRHPQRDLHDAALPAGDRPVARHPGHPLPVAARGAHLPRLRPPPPVRRTRTTRSTRSSPRSSNPVRGAVNVAGPGHHRPDPDGPAGGPADAAGAGPLFGAVTGVGRARLGVPELLGRLPAAAALRPRRRHHAAARRSASRRASRRRRRSRTTLAARTARRGGAPSAAGRCASAAGRRRRRADRRALGAAIGVPARAARGARRRARAARGARARRRPRCRATRATASSGRAPARRRLPRGRVGLRRGVRRVGLPVPRLPLRPLVAGARRRASRTCPAHGRALLAANHAGHPARGTRR